MNKTIIAALLSAAFLAACGGGGSDNDTAENPAAPPAPAAQAGTSTGVLSDSPVGGVQYTTSGGYSGATDANGRYHYNPGETVTFKIGAITLGTVTATGTVTPLELAAAAASGNKENIATNLLVLLQSLDADGDASNGITINDATKTAAASATVDLTQAPATFASSANSTLTAVMNGGGVAKTAPVSEAEALAHFKSEFFKNLAGSWVSGDAEGVIVIRFDAEGHYIIGEIAEADDSGHSGAEVGRINWDGKTGNVTLVEGSIQHDSNGDWGLNQAAGSEVFRIDGDKFTVTDEDGTVTTFNRVKNNTTSPLIGAWAIGSGTTINTQTFTFLENGKYLMADPIGDPGCAPDGGIEYGTYSYTASTGILTVTGTPQADTNGCAGLWNGTTPSSLKLTFDEANATIALEEDGAQVATLHRVSK